MYLFHLNNQDWLASLFGGISLLYRQTNIVWMFFLASYTSLTIIAKYTEKAKKKSRPAQVIKATAPQILQSCGGYAIFGLLFLAFVVLNRGRICRLNVAIQVKLILCNVHITGIVVGDRNAHEAALHIPQLLYFVGFVSCFSFQYIFTPSNARAFCTFAAKNRLAVAATVLLMALALYKFTYAHPYLLADNRHYTFYLWRRILSRESPSFLKYMYIPVYAFSAFSGLTVLQGKDTLWKCLFVACTAVSIVPQQLLELRYFLIPFVVWRLNIVASSTYQLVVEFVLNITINCFVLYLFLYKPFKWTGSHAMQRFMW